MVGVLRGFGFGFGDEIRQPLHGPQQGGLHVTSLSPPPGHAANRRAVHPSQPRTPRVSTPRPGHVRQALPTLVGFTAAQMST